MIARFRIWMRISKPTRSLRRVATTAAAAEGGRGGGKGGGRPPRPCQLCDSTTHVVGACPALVQARSLSKPAPGPSSISSALRAKFASIDAQLASQAAVPLAHPVEPLIGRMGQLQWQVPSTLPSAGFSMEMDNAELDRLLDSAGLDGPADGAF
jgi:hypothetical protein